jgi:hypothetical protein
MMLFKLAFYRFELCSKAWEKSTSCKSDFAKFVLWNTPLFKLAPLIEIPDKSNPLKEKPDLFKNEILLAAKIENLLFYLLRYTNSRNRFENSNFNFCEIKSMIKSLWMKSYWFKIYFSTSILSLIGLPFSSPINPDSH